LDYSYLLRRLHSLSGLFPIGLFIFIHFTINSLLGVGSLEFNNVVAVLHKVPYLWILELLILGGFLFHAVYGIYIVFSAKNNVTSYSNLRNWLFLLQRITAIVIVFFVLYHLITLKLSGFRVEYQTVKDALSGPISLGVLIIGGLATIIHFTNGFSTWLISWGITSGKRSQSFFAYAAVIIFALLALMGIRILSFLV